MSGARQFAASAYLMLKGATRRLVKTAGGVEGAALVTRLDKSTLSRAGSPNTPHFLAVDCVMDLEADVGDPILTRHMADVAGYMLIPKPDVGACQSWVAAIGEMGKESGEAILRISEAIGPDGQITAERAVKMELDRECREAMEVLARVRVALSMLDAENAKGV